VIESESLITVPSVGDASTYAKARAAQASTSRLPRTRRSILVSPEWSGRLYSKIRQCARVDKVEIDLPNGIKECENPGRQHGGASPLPKSPEWKSVDWCPRPD